MPLPRRPGRAGSFRHWMAAPMALSEAPARPLRCEMRPARFPLAVPARRTPVRGPEPAEQWGAHNRRVREAPQLPPLDVGFECGGLHGSLDWGAVERAAQLPEATRLCPSRGARQRHPVHPSMTPSTRSRPRNRRARGAAELAVAFGECGSFHVRRLGVLLGQVDEAKVCECRRRGAIRVPERRYSAHRSIQSSQRRKAAR